MSEPTHYDLLENILSCVTDNNFERLTQLLKHPFAKDAVQENNAHSLRFACAKNRFEFIDVLLPYCGDKEIGLALTFCLSNLRLESFDRIVGCNRLCGGYICVTALDLLLDLHHSRLNTSEEPLRRQALERFLDWVPQTRINQSVSMIEHYCHSDRHKARRIDAFDALVAQRQKQRLEKEIDVEHHAVVRKM